MDIIRDAMRSVVLLFEILGVVAILGGFMLAVASAFSLRTGGIKARYERLRRFFGRSLLLGLEILLGADLVRTIAVEPSLDSLYVLGALVLIRSFLSWSLDVELEGAWPWHRRELDEQAAAQKRAERVD